MASSLKPLFDQTDPNATGILKLGVAGNGDLRWAAVDLTAPVEAMRLRLDLSPIATVALGRAMASAVLLLRFSTKRPGKLRVDVLGDGPLGRVIAEADSLGYVRGMVDEPKFAGFDGGGIEVGRAVGSGLFRVTQELTDRPQPWVSQTALVDGEIGNDLVHYLLQSQQIRSAALLAVYLKSDGVRAAGGLLIEAFPGAETERVVRLEKNIEKMGGVGNLLAQGGVEELLDSALEGLGRDDLESHPMLYTCGCSRDSLLERLRGLGSEDLRDLADENGKAVLECAFCNGEMVFSLDELQT